MEEKNNNLKNKFISLFNKWDKLSNHWKIVSLTIVILVVLSTIIIPVTISSNSFTEEHKTAYDLVTHYYYDILDDYNLDQANDFKVLKCSVHTYNKDTPYYFSGGWFYIEINNTYKVYYYLQLDSTGESCCQYAPNSLGESWAFKNAITTNVLNKKLKDFVEKENLKI